MATDVEKMMKDYMAAWNSHDVDKILSFFTDDCVYEDVATGVVNHGKKELISWANNLFTNMPDFQIEIKSGFGAGDWGGSEWVMTGTHAHSSNPAIPATGKRFSVRGASITEFQKGKISRNTDYWSLATFLQQVGLMPAPPK
jgi:steroid delta-isomerase-like uncharacterized protein